MHLFTCPACAQTFSGLRFFCKPCLRALLALRCAGDDAKDAAFYYEGPTAALITELRERPSFSSLRFCERLLRRNPRLIALLSASEAIATVPSNAKAGRGLNILVARLARRHNLQDVSDLLIKNKGHAQHGRTERERMDCPRFIHLRANAPAQTGRALLLDDVCTTGTSLEQAALALLDAGFTEIKWFTLALRREQARPEP